MTKRFTGRVEILEITETPKKSNCRCIGTCGHSNGKDKESFQVTNLVIRADDLSTLKSKLIRHLDLI